MTSKAKPRKDYSLFREISRTDKRQAKWRKQRETRGFDDTETWGLNTVIAQFVLPRLKCFKKLNNGIQPGFTGEDWDAALDDMIYAMEVNADDERSFDKTVDWDRVMRGQQLFGEHFRGLWW